MENIIKFISDGKVFNYFRNNQNGKQPNVSDFFRREKIKVTNYIRKKYQLDLYEAEDCFMEGSIALWRNISDGILTEDNLTGSLSTYLMRCCCNHATHILAKKKRSIPLDSLFKQPKKTEEEDGTQNDDDGGFDREDHFDYEDEKIFILEKIVRELPEPCYTILWNVYFNYHEVELECEDNETIMDVIALMLGMKKTVLKTTKNRCMQKVKNKAISMQNNN